MDNVPTMWHTQPPAYIISANSPVKEAEMSLRPFDCEENEISGNSDST